MLLLAASCGGRRQSTNPAPPAIGTLAADLTTTLVAGVGQHCGTERWAVKTLSDPDAYEVNLTPVARTVHDLRGVPAPRDLPTGARVAATELTTYVVTARVAEFKLEADRDIHVVIADPQTGERMIAEFPDADRCVGAVSSAEADQMRAARAALIAQFGEPPATHYQRIDSPATLTGVGFFDIVHGQRGAAPNGIELHPVIVFSP